MTESAQKTECPTVTGCALTESERMFEAYLISHGITSWTHPKKARSGKRKSPDYFVPFRELRVGFRG